LPLAPQRQLAAAACQAAAYSAGFVLQGLGAGAGAASDAALAAAVAQLAGADAACAAADSASQLAALCTLQLAPGGAAAGPNLTAAAAALQAARADMPAAAQAVLTGAARLPAGVTLYVYLLFAAGAPAWGAPLAAALAAAYAERGAPLGAPAAAAAACGPPEVVAFVTVRAGDAAAARVALSAPALAAAALPALPGATGMVPLTSPAGWLADAGGSGAAPLPPPAPPAPPARYEYASLAARARERYAAAFSGADRAPVVSILIIPVAFWPRRLKKTYARFAVVAVAVSFLAYVALVPRGAAAPPPAPPPPPPPPPELAGVALWPPAPAGLARADAALALQADVRSGAPDTLAAVWNQLDGPPVAFAADADAPARNATAATGRARSTLAFPPGALAPGAVYAFQFLAADEGGRVQAVVSFQTAPLGGGGGGAAVAAAGCAAAPSAPPLPAAALTCVAAAAAGGAAPPLVPPLRAEFAAAAAPGGAPYAVAVVDGAAAACLRLEAPGAHVSVLLRDAAGTELRGAAHVLACAGAPGAADAADAAAALVTAAQGGGAVEVASQALAAALTRDAAAGAGAGARRRLAAGAPAPVPLPAALEAAAGASLRPEQLAAMCARAAAAAAAAGDGDALAAALRALLAGALAPAAPRGCVFSATLAAAAVDALSAAVRAGAAAPPPARAAAAAAAAALAECAAGSAPRAPREALAAADGAALLLRCDAPLPLSRLYAPAALALAGGGQFACALPLPDAAAAAEAAPPAAAIVCLACLALADDVAAPAAAGAAAAPALVARVAPAAAAAAAGAVLLSLPAPAPAAGTPSAACAAAAGAGACVALPRSTPPGSAAAFNLSGQPPAWQLTGDALRGCTALDLDCALGADAQRAFLGLGATKPPRVFLDPQAPHGAPAAACAPGATARLRVFYGAACALWREGNALGCWWDVRLQAFAGPSCVTAAAAQCACAAGAAGGAAAALAPPPFSAAAPAAVLQPLGDGAGAGAGASRAALGGLAVALVALAGATWAAAAAAAAAERAAAAVAQPPPGGRLSAAAGAAMAHLLTPQAGFVETSAGAWIWSLRLEAADTDGCHGAAEPPGGAGVASAAAPPRLARPRGPAAVVALALGLPLARLRVAIPEPLWPCGSLAACVGRPGGLSPAALDATAGAYAAQCRRLWAAWLRGLLPRRRARGEPHTLAALSRRLRPRAPAAGAALEEAGAPAPPPPPDTADAAAVCGTALVLAHATLFRLLPPEALQSRLRAARQHFAAARAAAGDPGARWRDFDALYAAFAAMLAPAGPLHSADGEEWAAAARVWRLVLSQRADGSWDASPAVAVALQARLDAEDGTAVCPLTFDAAAVRRSMPRRLRREYDAAQRRRDKRSRQQPAAPEGSHNPIPPLLIGVAEEADATASAGSCVAAGSCGGVVAARGASDEHGACGAPPRDGHDWRVDQSAPGWGLPLLEMQHCLPPAFGYEPSEAGCAPEAEPPGLRPAVQDSARSIAWRPPRPPRRGPRPPAARPAEPPPRRRDARPLRCWATLLALELLRASSFMPVARPRAPGGGGDGGGGASPFATPVDAAEAFLERGESAHPADVAERRQLAAAAAAQLAAWADAQAAAQARSLTARHCSGAGARLSRHAHALVASVVTCTRCRHDTLSALLAPRGAALARAQRVTAALTALLAAVAGAAALRAVRAAGCCAEARALLGCAPDDAACRGVRGSCAALADVFLGVQDSGLLEYRCTRFPADTPRDTLLAGLLVSVGTSAVGALLGRAARRRNEAGVAAQLDAAAAGAAAPPPPLVRVADASGAATRAAAAAAGGGARAALLAWRWRAAAPAAALPPAARAAARLALAPSPGDAALDAAAAALAAPAALLRAPPARPPWARLLLPLWALLVGGALGAAAVTDALEGGAAVRAFFLGAAATLALDQLAQWRDVYQEVFEALVARAGAEALALKKPAQLFPELLDYFSTQSLLYDDADDADGAPGAPADGPGARGGAAQPRSGALGHVVTLWMASRSVDQ
jgi:hypothetical protein